MNIRQKLIVLLLAVGLIPAAVLSLVAYATISNEITNQTLQQLTSVALKQDQKINLLLRNKLQDVTSLLLSYEFNRVLTDYFKNPSPANRDALTTMLANKKTSATSIETALVANLDGVVGASTNKNLVGKQLQPDEFSLPEGDRTRMVFREDLTDNLNKLYVIGEVDLNNKKVGYLVMKFGVSDIVESIQDYSGLGETGETIIASTSSDQRAISQFPLRFNTTAALTGDVSSLKLADKTNEVYDNLTDYRGHEVFSANRYIDLAQWNIAAKIDKSEALQPIAGLRDAIVAIFGIALVAIIVLSLYLARAFSKPIVTLTQKTQAIIGGDFTQKIQVTSSDEIGTLARGFNTMTDKLAQSYEALEQKVVERTQALNNKVQELGRAKAKDDAMLSSIGDGVIVTDNQGLILLVNNAAEGLLNITAQNAVGQYIADAYALFDTSGKQFTDEERPTSRALTTGQRIVVEASLPLGGTSKRFLTLTATPVKEAGVVIGAIQTIRDTTKEKEVDRMKTEFISLASHQLRTPLSAIKWFSEMLLSGDAGKLAPEQTEFTKNIADSSERMIDLVNSLLDVSRMESGRVIIDPKPTDVNELVQGIINDLKGKTEAKRQVLVVSIHKDLPKINLDPRLIGQVYLNFLTNAIKYTPEGGEISVIVSRKGDDLVSQVTDNGYGIPVAQQAKVFQKFFRAENIIKVETDGTGLGLYLVKEIIESSGGKVWFKSEEGKGTSFWFSIPMSGMKAKKGEVTIGS